MIYSFRNSTGALNLKTTTTPKKANLHSSYRFQLRRASLPRTYWPPVSKLGREGSNLRIVNFFECGKPERSHRLRTYIVF